MASIFHVISGKVGWRLFCSAMVLMFLAFPGTSALGEEVSGTISVDTTWSLSGSPYIVTGDVTVNNSATLTIEAGVEIRFEPETGLFIGSYRNNFGSLSAKGSEEVPIIFTSNLSSPVSGSWKSIYFTSYTTDVTTMLEHCIVEYGGQKYDANIYCKSSYPAIKNCTIRHSSGYPIRAEAKKMNLSGNTYTDNGKQGTLIEGGTIDEDTTWGNKGDESTYVVTGDVTVNNSSVLTIEAGAEIRFGTETGLFIGSYRNNFGSLSAKGTEEAPIVFTSNLSSPVSGSWKGIYFTSYTTDALTTLEHCIVEYGGQSYKTNIYCKSSYPSITNCTLRYSSGYPIRVEAKKMNLSGNTYTDNGKQGTLIEGGTIDEDTTWGNKGDESTYVVTGDITVNNSSVLTIEAGAEIRFGTETGLFIGSYRDSFGSLSAKGTENAPIVFTSNLSSPVSGSWQGIRFTSYTVDATTILEHCIVEYGGQNVDDHNVYLNNASPTIQYNTIRNGSHSGICVKGSGSGEAVINCNNISSNGKYGIYITDSATPQITNNNFAMNQTGLYNNSSGVVEAKNNWWNDASGPNAGGDTVSGNVEFDPWLTKQSDCVSDDDPLPTPDTTVTTNEATNITSVSTTCGGNITSDDGADITARGVCWGTSQNPTIADAHTSDGTGAGSFTSQITDLSPDTTYYVRAYATDSAETSYGDEVSFKTLSASDALSLSVTPASLNVSETGGTATFEVANTGTGTMEWTASEDAEWFSISPESGTYSETDWWPIDGTVTVTYDANDSDAERIGTITVTASGATNSPQTVEVRQAAQVSQPAPDLIIQSQNANPTTLKAGSEISVSCEVRNQGDASSAPGTITYYLSADTVYDSADTLLGTEPLNSLPVSGTSSETATLTIPSGTSPGIWHLLFRADVSDEVAESDEDNNLSYQEITITSDPPTPPTSLDARSGVDSVRLHWGSSISAHIKGYDVYRSESDVGPWTNKIATEVTGEDYEDASALSVGTTYYYCLKTVDTFGNESGYSEVASTVFGHLKLFIPDASENKGALVRLPIKIANADKLNMCGLDIYVTYDETVLVATGIERSPLSLASGWKANIDTPGIVDVILSTGQNEEVLNGEGTFFWLTFNVTGDDGANTKLEFRADSSGSTDRNVMYDCVEPDPNEISLDLSDSGLFTVNSEKILCDLNKDGNVDSADNNIILDLAVGDRELTDELLDIGDSSGDRRIDSKDSIMCLRIATGDELSPSFSEEKRRNVRSSSVNVSIGNTSVPAEGSIRVPINISNAEDVAGADIVLNYDPNLVTATNVRTTSLTENSDLEFNVQTGQVRISLSTTDVSSLFQGSGSLVEVEFTAQSNVAENSVSPLTLASVRLNDTFSRDFATSALQTDVKTTSGSLRIGDFNLHDAILALKILTGTDASGIGLDADQNGKVGMEDVLLILKDVAGTMH